MIVYNFFSPEIELLSDRNFWHFSLREIYETHQLQRIGQPINVNVPKWSDTLSKRLMHLLKNVYHVFGHFEIFILIYSV